VPRWSFPIVLWAISTLVPHSVLASRAALDGRGLPYLLAIDPSNAVIFPGSAALFGRSALLDYTPYVGSDPIYDYYLRPEAVRYVGPLVDPVRANPQRFILGLTGKTLAFGYAMDGRSHNLILSHHSGWGISVGIEDKYDNLESYERSSNPPYSAIRNSSLEISRRDVKFALGWSLGNNAERTYEVGATADVVYMQYSTTQFYANSDTTIAATGEWRSEPGLGFDLRLRTLSPVSGFQGAVRFAYEDLQPDVSSGPQAAWIRRYGVAELGWRFPMKALDDFVAGVVLEWSRDSITGPQGSSYSYLRTTSAEVTQYYGQLFASAEHVIVQRLIGRAGVRGSAYFNEQETLDVEARVGSITTSVTKRSQGGIYDPEFFLGAAWTWKRFEFDGRLRDNIDLDNPLVQWSVGYSW